MEPNNLNFYSIIYLRKTAIKMMMVYKVFQRLEEFE